MFIGKTWVDHKKVVVWSKFCDEPEAQRAFSGLGGAGVAAAVLSVLEWVFDLTSRAPAFPLIGAVVFCGIIGGVLGPRWFARKWRSLEEKGLVDSGSYAFTALKNALAERTIHIGDMNDWLDHKVGPVHITAFLNRIRDHSRLIGSENLNEEWRGRLRAEVDQIVPRYADLIKDCFDQRELARQARERGHHRESRRIEAKAQAQVEAFYLAERAEQVSRAAAWMR